jgi:hypothetical protein
VADTRFGGAGTSGAPAGDKVGSRSFRGSGGSHIAGGDGGGRRKKGLAVLLVAAALSLLLVALVVLLVALNPADIGDRSGLDLRNDKKAADQAGAGPSAGGQGAQPAQLPTAGPGSLVVGGRSLIEEASGGRYAQLNGQAVEGRGVTVQSVVADEGFWVGSSEQSRAFVFLTPQARMRAGESPFQVRAGQRVDLTGVVKPVPADITPFGVDRIEGADQLRAQGYYVEANSVRLG